MPVSVAKRIFSRSGVDSFAIAPRSPDNTVLKGSRLASSGLPLTSAGTRSRQYTTWLYIGCSTHSVPSWSKVAIRASVGTKLGLDGSVVAFTKFTIACLAGPSFHDGRAGPLEGASASAEVGTTEVKRIASATSVATKTLRLVQGRM